MPIVIISTVWFDDHAKLVCDLACIAAAALLALTSEFGSPSVNTNIFLFTGLAPRLPVRLASIPKSPAVRLVVTPLSPILPNSEIIEL